MKFKILLVLFFLPLILEAQALIQTPLKFDKNFWECENKWVVSKELNPNDSTFLGFIYLDEVAGYTEQLTSHIKLTSSGDLKLTQLDSSISKISIKVRLSDGESPFLVIRKNEAGKETKTVRMDGQRCKYAILPDDIVKQLGLPKEPEWLVHYQKDTTTAAYFTKIGFHLNHVGRSDSALIFLEKAYQLNPRQQGLGFELAFAYNAIENCSKAIEIINIELENSPNNELLYKELGYAYLHTSQYSDAEKTYIKGIGISTSDRTKAEMSMNLLNILLHQNRIIEIDIWIKKAKEFAKDIPYYLRNIEAMEKYINNQKK